MKKILTRKINSKPVQDIEALIDLLMISKPELEKIIKKIPASYRDIAIKKSDGSFRHLDAPNKELKAIQKKVLDYYIGQIKLPHFVFGIGKNKTILENVKAHVIHEELVVIDIKNFFPSVHYTRVKTLYENLGCDDEVSDLLTKLTTLNYHLPQGTPTSPYVASLCLSNLDKRLYALCKVNRLIYTRYFDDIAISGAKIADELVATFITVIEQEGYECKKEKIHHYKAGEKRKLTGIDIEGKEEILPYITELRDHGLSKLKSDNPEKERKILRGKINFITSILPNYGLTLREVFDKIGW
jgi:RNA-directed DNA polymerase